MTNRKRILRRNARKDADRFHRPGGPQARKKTSRRDAQPAPARSCSKGFGGAATNKQKWPSRRGRDGHFSHDGTIMPCLPCFVSPIFGICPSPHHQCLRLLLVRRCAIKLIEPPAICCPHQLYLKVEGILPAVFQPLIPLFGSLSLVGPGRAVVAGEREDDFIIGFGVQLWSSA